MGRNMRALQYYYIILNQIEDSLVIKEYFADGNGSFTGGEICCASRVKAEHYNLNIETILGKTDFDLMPHDQALKALEDDIWVMQHRESIRNKEELITYPDGRTVRKSTTKSPLFYDNGEIGGVICISRNIDN